MLLSEWVAENDAVVTDNGPFSKSVMIDHPGHRDLWNLTDWKVESVTSGMVWLRKKLDRHLQSQRMNIRNCFMLATRDELLAARPNYDQFGQLCIDEMISALDRENVSSGAELSSF